MEKLQFILSNWEVISLILTNIAALFIEKPQNWRNKNVQTKKTENEA